MIHIVWIGDESKRPDDCIDTWKKHHEVRVWGNDDLKNRSWFNAKHMMTFTLTELCGVADMMRYEILYEEGGIAVDADSICERKLEDWMFETPIAAWENEIERPGLIANGTLGAQAKNPLIGQIINDIQKDEIYDRKAWQFSGPQRLTDAWKKYKYNELTILPSHFFYPEHFSGQVYTGKGPIYARQFWASTRSIHHHISN